MYVYTLSHSYFFSSLPLSKALFISPCLLHVDMENILGGNRNDSYIHTVSLLSVFVFKLHFSPNRVYKPCLTSADQSLLYSLDSATQGCSTGKELLKIYTFLRDNWRNFPMDYGSWTNLLRLFRHLKVSCSLCHEDQWHFICQRLILKCEEF